MLKKLLGAILIVPVVILLSLWGVNFISGVLTGEVNLVTFILDHKILIALVLAYFGFKYLNPFNKD